MGSDKNWPLQTYIKFIALYSPESRQFNGIYLTTGSHHLTTTRREWKVPNIAPNFFNFKNYTHFEHPDSLDGTRKSGNMKSHNAEINWTRRGISCVTIVLLLNVFSLGQGEKANVLARETRAGSRRPTEPYPSFPSPELIDSSLRTPGGALFTFHGSSSLCYHIKPFLSRTIAVSDNGWNCLWSSW